MGMGCDKCDGGYFTVDCPREFCSSLNDEINIASMASKGFLPVAGGLLDQSSWFLQLLSTLDEEHMLLDNERFDANE